MTPRGGAIDDGTSGAPLIVCADDFGLTAATSEAILRAHDQGIVTATSVLTLAPGAIGRVPSLGDVPAMAVGVHLALVGEDPPLLSAREVPTLVDRHGHLAPSWRHLIPRLAARRIDVDDVRREFSAQIDAVGSQRPIDHLDSHQHVHLWPAIAEIVVELARTEGISRVRVPRPSNRGLRSRVIEAMADRLRRRIGEADLLATEHFAGLDEAGAWTGPMLVRALERLARAGGSVELNMHPGPAEDPDRLRYRWQYGWARELDALTDGDVVAAVETHGYELAGRLQ